MHRSEVSDGESSEFAGRDEADIDDARYATNGEKADTQVCFVLV